MNLQISFLIIYFRFNDPMVIPYAKESPFKRPMNEAFEKMRSFGILSDILQKYEPIKDDSCGNPKVRFFKIWCCSKL